MDEPLNTHIPSPLPQSDYICEKLGCKKKLSKAFSL